MTFRLNRVPSTRPTSPTSAAIDRPAGLRGRTFRRLVAAALVGASLLGGLVASSEAAPKPGVVKDKQGVSYVGQVDEAAIAGKVVITDAKGSKTELFMQRVESIQYFDSVQAEFDARLAALNSNNNKKDLAGRVALAKWALEKKEPDLAARAAAEAKAINPASPEVAALDAQIAKVRPAPVATAPATGPATVPVAVSHGPAKRTLTPEEIQLVRLREMKPGDKTARIQVPQELRKKAVDAGLITAAELRTIPPAELGMRILKSENEAMRNDVKIQTDPAPLAEFRLKVNKPLVAGCASAACHGQAQAGGFALFPDPAREEQALSNLVILQKHKSADGQREMLNRTQPDASLLLGYMLPPEVSPKAPHPMLKEYKGMVRTVQDPVFVATRKWLSDSLVPYPPSYDDIDLTADPKPADAPRADAGTGRAATAAKASR
jgi:hypothetical protein